MRRIGRAALIFASAWLLIGSSWAGSDEIPIPSPQAVALVDRLLAEWQAKTSTITSIEVRFRRTDDSVGWRRSRSTGRAILAAPNLAWVEFHSVGEDGKVTGLKERMIWNDKSILQFNGETDEVSRFPRPRNGHRRPANSACRSSSG